MVNVAERTLNEVDVVLWLVEPTTFIGAGERHIAEQLKQGENPGDPGDQQDRHGEKTGGNPDLYRRLQGRLPVCGDRAPVRAEETGIRTCLTELIFKYLPYGPQFYDEDTVTDQPMRQIAAELIREKALRLLDDEIPHGIAVAIEQMKERKNGMMDIDASIVCERESHKGIIIGKGGSMLKRIGNRGPERDRGHDGDSGEPAAVGEGPQGVAGQ